MTFYRQRCWLRQQYWKTKHKLHRVFEMSTWDQIKIVAILHVVGLQLMTYHWQKQSQNPEQLLWNHENNVART